MELVFHTTSGTSRSRLPSIFTHRSRISIGYLSSSLLRSLECRSWLQHPDEPHPTGWNEREAPGVPLACKATVFGDLDIRLMCWSSNSFGNQMVLHVVKHVDWRGCFKCANMCQSKLTHWSFKSRRSSSQWNWNNACGEPNLDTNLKPEINGGFPKQPFAT